jgi:hypothetical protein
MEIEDEENYNRSIRGEDLTKRFDVLQPWTDIIHHGRGDFWSSWPKWCR